jgi:clathrin heavy chain
MTWTAMDDTDAIKVSQLLDLTSQGIRVSDITFARVRQTSDQWLCILSRRERPSKDGFINHAIVVNLKSNHVRSFEMEGLFSAQVNPIKPVIALASKEKIFVVDLNTHECTSWNRFPCEVEYWGWMSKNVVGIIGSKSVYHWNTDTDQLTFMFERHIRLQGNQISGYCSDAKLSWFVIRSLFQEDDGSIGGILQVFSSEYDQSNCIEGHAATIIDHKLVGRETASSLLILVKKVTSKLVKLSVTELGPRNKATSHALISRNESFSWTNHDDIPSLLVCSSNLRLIYLLSKMGYLFVFELETCTPIILHQRICHDIVFQSVLETCTQGVIATSRNGQVLHIEVNDQLKTKSMLPVQINGSVQSRKSIPNSSDVLLSTCGQDHDKDKESSPTLDENEVTRL